VAGGVQSRDRNNKIIDTTIAVKMLKEGRGKVATVQCKGHGKRALRSGRQW
jgi:hypothetical protein